MKALIIVQYNNIGSALKRYLKFVINIKSEVITFQQIKQQKFPDAEKYNFFISNVYEFDNNLFRTTGLQYIALFERNKPCIIYFYDNYLKSEYTIRDLPENCFYLPLQINDFLQYIHHPKQSIKSADKLKKMFYSSGLTRKH